MSVVWERVGECPPEQCQGRCCKFATFGPFITPAEDKGEADWAELRGLDVVEVGRQTFLNASLECAALTADGLCGLYDGPVEINGKTYTRPQRCADWPRTPADLAMTPWCGYSFRAVAAATA